MEFEWDDANLEHIAEHDVSPEEVEDVFYNHPLRINSEVIEEELRHEIVGETNEERILTIIWTERRGRIRTVTAFDASLKDLKRYLRFKGGKR